MTATSAMAASAAMEAAPVKAAVKHAGGVPETVGAEAMVKPVMVEEGKPDTDRIAVIIVAVIVVGIRVIICVRPVILIVPGGVSLAVLDVIGIIAVDI
jgi:hypothetical protein